MNNEKEVASLKLSINQLETALAMNDTEFLKCYAVMTTLTKPVDVTDEFAIHNAESNLVFLRKWLKLLEE